MGAVSGALGDLSSGARSAPAVALATVTGTVSVLPRLLLGDAVAAYQILSDTFSGLGATGGSLSSACLVPIGICKHLLGCLIDPWATMECVGLECFARAVHMQ